MREAKPPMSHPAIFCSTNRRLRSTLLISIGCSKPVSALTRRWHIGALAIVHDPNLAARYADSIALLADGTIIAQGAPRDIMQPALIERCFGFAVRMLDAGRRLGPGCGSGLTVRPPLAKEPDQRRRARAQLIACLEDHDEVAHRPRVAQ